MHPLVAEIPEDPVPCWADRERLAEVLDNLVLERGEVLARGRRPCISRSAATTRRAVVSVRDHGIGIAAKATWTGCSGLSRACATCARPDIEGSGLGLSHLRSRSCAHTGPAEVKTAARRGLDLLVHRPALRRRRPRPGRP